MVSTQKSALDHTPGAESFPACNQPNSALGRLGSLSRSSLRPASSTRQTIHTPSLHPQLLHTTFQARHTSSRSGSSSQWLARQGSDPFVKSRQSSHPKDAPTTSYVARSAFKLLELQQKTHLLRPGMTVVDLGAAPGGWVQAAHPALFPKGDRGRARRGRILALDLLPLHKSVQEMDGVEFVQGDFLDPVTQGALMDLLPRGGGGVDLVLSDMLANLSGNPLRDAQLSLDLCQAALQFALLHLSPSPPASKAVEGGKKVKSPVRLVMKALRSELSPEFEQELKGYFASVNWIKPQSSRPESREGFWVCRGLKALKAVEE